MLDLFASNMETVPWESAKLEEDVNHEDGSDPIKNLPEVGVGHSREHTDKSVDLQHAQCKEDTFQIFLLVDCSLLLDFYMADTEVHHDEKCKLEHAGDELGQLLEPVNESMVPRSPHLNLRF